MAGFQQNKGFQGAAAFDFRSIFSNEIKEMGWKQWQRTAQTVEGQGAHREDQRGKIGRGVDAARRTGEGEPFLKKSRRI